MKKRNIVFSLVVLSVFIVSVALGIATARDEPNGKPDYLPTQDFAKMDEHKAGGAWNWLLGVLTYLYNSVTDLQDEVEDLRADVDALDNHTHDWSEIKNKPSVFPPADHDHDDRYYTKGQVDTELSQKADTDDVNALDARVTTLENTKKVVAGKIEYTVTATPTLPFEIDLTDLNAASAADVMVVASGYRIEDGNKATPLAVKWDVVDSPLRVRLWVYDRDGHPPDIGTPGWDNNETLVVSFSAHAW